MERTQEKYHELIRYLTELGSVVVAFSGGVDSTLLAQAAYEALGDKAVAITIQTAFNPRREIAEAIELAACIGIRHELVQFDVLQNSDVVANPPQRCYFCKKAIFTYMLEYSAQNGYRTVIDGSNVDDSNEYRPGKRALAELGVLSPLVTCGLRKSDIREISRMLSLPTAEKPSFACLASRLPYGDPFTEHKLLMIEQAEEVLHALGYQESRVRHHGGIARIELAARDIPLFICSGEYTIVSQQLKEIGYEFIALDLEGYRTGSFDTIYRGGNNDRSRPTQAAE